MNHLAPPKVDLQQLIASARLPALPQTALRLLELSNDPENGPKEFAQPIEADPGLLGQVLRFVNSSYFGFSREIASIQQALALVGVRTIKNFALWSAVFSLVPDPKFGPFDLKKLWQDSLRRAIFARILGRRMKLANSEDLFAAALLQDLAIPLLLQELPEDYQALIERRAIERRRLSELERDLFGWDHAQVAAALVRTWRLPEAFAILIERHPKLDELLESQPPALDAACVALAALLPSGQDQQWDDREAFYQGCQEIGELSEESIQEMLAESDQVFVEFAPLLKLANPERSLSDWYAAPQMTQANH